MPIMQGLTDRQQQVLKYIRDSIVERGYPPTLREIGAHMGIRSSTITCARSSERATSDART